MIHAGPSKEGDLPKSAGWPKVDRMIARELMDENDRPTTIAYWVKLTLVALAIRLLAAFYVFLAVPQGDDPFIYAKQAVGIRGDPTRARSISARRDDPIA